jgi:hypothetical protein
VNRGGGFVSNRIANLRASSRYSDEPTNHGLRRLSLREVAAWSFDRVG